MDAHELSKLNDWHKRQVIKILEEKTMEKIKVKLDAGYGKNIYLHIANGVKRIELLEMGKAGVITNAEMNQLARKYPYHIKEIEILRHPEKYQIIESTP